MTTDRRNRPANERVALSTLRGQVQAPRFTDGQRRQVVQPLVDLCASPGGARDRQLRLGAAVLQLESHAGWSFVQHLEDGYVGYLPDAAIGDAPRPTHRVITLGSHAYDAPKVQAHERCALPMDARISFTAQENGFAHTAMGWIPIAHLRPLNQPYADPVSVAERLIGVPYLWGGNSAFGLDCSGLVQMTCNLCSIPCPGDADQQECDLGEPVPAGADLLRGDLLFWRGHVAWVVDPQTIIHANGHSMSVAHEDLRAALERIGAHEYGALTSRRRITPPA